MDASSPILDQPQSIDFDLLPAGPLNGLANQELHCQADALSDPSAITWPWGGGVYAQSIRLTISDWQEGPLVPLVVRFFPGHQETIMGSEGVIVTKRLIIPWKGPEDRALLWLLECQAEGDRLVKLVIEIDWGEPLTQRMVDGLLLAQRNPEDARGIYAQSNAESTRVFGDPNGQPVQVHLEDPQRARLEYLILVNGIVEVPLLLTFSDVGEQMAWNSFLALRDVEQIFDTTTNHWQRLMQLGRLWTPDPAFNRAVATGRLHAIRQVQHLRTGWAPSDRQVIHTHLLVAAWDTVDPVISRNLLAHLRRVAEANGGWLPEFLPWRAREPAAPPDSAAVAAFGNGVYLHSLNAHCTHHGDPSWLAEHYPVAQRCAEQLVQLRWRDRAGTEPPIAQQVLAIHLQQAVQLAERVGDEVNAVRWEQEVADMARRGGVARAERSARQVYAGWQERYHWQPRPDRPWSFAVPAEGMALAADAIWQGCGLTWQAGGYHVAPSWPDTWPWWALLSLPLANGKHLSLLWDGTVLHATQPVTSSLPVVLHQKIQLQRTDEFDFDPYFELTPPSNSGDTGAKVRFRPKFL